MSDELAEYTHLSSYVKPKAADSKPSLTYRESGNLL